jgi:hypothetical protein
MKLTAIFKKVRGGYVGFVEELPGANTQGRTLAETRTNLKEAVSPRAGGESLARRVRWQRIEPLLFQVGKKIEDRCVHLGGLFLRTPDEPFRPSDIAGGLNAKLWANPRNSSRRTLAGSNALASCESWS